MTPPEAAPNPPPIWTKAIPPARDRLQSRILVWVVVPALFAASIHLLHLALTGPWHPYVPKVLVLSGVFAFAAWALGAATPAAALVGGMICLLMTFWTARFDESPLHSALTPLLSLFVLTFLATRAGRRQKMHRGLAEARKGRRASQVVANLGVAALLSTSWGVTAIAWLAQDSKTSGEHPEWIVWIILLAALGEATADTVSSEIGQAFGGKPFLLTTLRRVEPGVDGGITLIGTFAGILAAAIVSALGAWSMRLDLRQECIALAAATLGLFFDSLLGATVERRGYLGNDLVNFASTAFAAAIAFPLARLASR